MKTYSSLDEVKDDIIHTFQVWIDLHFDFDVWFEDYCCGYAPAEAMRCGLIDDEISVKSSIIGEKVFTIDWARVYAIKALAQETFYRCERHGRIVWPGEDCDECRYEDEPADLPADLVDIDENDEDAIELLEEIYPGIKYANFDELDVEEAVRAAFDERREWLSPHIEPVRDELQEAIEKLRSDDIFDVTWALHIAHVHGAVIRDYSGVAGHPDLYEALNDIQQGGVAAYFGEEADE